MHDYQYLWWGGGGWRGGRRRGGRKRVGEENEGRRETAKGGRKVGEESMFAGRLLGCNTAPVFALSGL